MTTYNLNIANISFNSSLDSRDIQSEIDNIESMVQDLESDLDNLNDELNDINEDDENYEIAYSDKQDEADECEAELGRYRYELEQLEHLKEEIESNSDEGFEYGIQLIHENDIDDYLDELLDSCGYIPNDMPTWIEIDWQATYNNMKQDYSEIELNGNKFYVR